MRYFGFPSIRASGAVLAFDSKILNVCLYAQSLHQRTKLDDVRLVTKVRQRLRKGKSCQFGQRKPGNWMTRETPGHILFTQWLTLNVLISEAEHTASLLR